MLDGRGDRRKQAEASVPPVEGSLMGRIHEGDATALSELLDRWWIPLVAYARRLTGSPDVAEDVVQETMVRVWERRDRWTPSDRLQSFLYRITRNLALNERRKHLVRSTYRERAQEAPPERRQPTPLELAERSELRTLLSEAVDALPPRQREIFVLARFHGHTYREIAEILDLSPQTVANQMSSALDGLRRRLVPHLGATGASRQDPVTPSPQGRKGR